MLLSDEEDQMLDALVDADGLSASDVVRQLIRRAYVAKWPAKKSKR